MNIREMKLTIKSPLYLVALAIFTLFSCSSEPSEKLDVPDEVLKPVIDPSANTIVKLNNTLFSIPSPYQMAFLIKGENLAYNPEFLNKTSNESKYSSNFIKSLNMGIYGADLGYLNMYEQNSEAIKYFTVLKKLSSSLGISGAFNTNIVKRIEANMGNKDSLLYILSNTYRNADQYLKDNNREQIGVLILAGGWIESLNMMCQLVVAEKNDKVIRRIGEQKHPLDNLIKILSPFYNDADNYKELIDGLIDLAYDFDAIEFTYTFEEPVTEADKNFTQVNGKSSTVITDEQLKTITNKIDVIRKKLVE